MVSKGKSASECFRLAELSGITFCLPWLAKVTPVSAALRMEKHLLLSLAANCWPDSTVPKWPSAFPNALLQDSAAAEFGRCWSASVTPGRAERTLITAQVCLVLFVGFFEAASVICRWEGKLLLPDFCSASAVTEVCPGMLVPSALSAARRELEGAITAQALPLSHPLEGLAFLWVSETVLMPEAVCYELHDLYLSKAMPALKIRETEIVWWRHTENSHFVTPSPVSWAYWGGSYLLQRIFWCASNQKSAATSPNTTCCYVQLRAVPRCAGGVCEQYQDHSVPSTLEWD